MELPSGVLLDGSPQEFTRYPGGETRHSVWKHGCCLGISCHMGMYAMSLHVTSCMMSDVREGMRDGGGGGGSKQCRFDSFIDPCPEALHIPESDGLEGVL